MGHTPTMKKSVTPANCNDQSKVLSKYQPNIGAPFKVVLIDSVVQEISSSGEIIQTIIPNLDGLLKEVAFARSLYPRKFSPADLKFVRKAIGLKAVDLADLLGVSPEHISRCEKGDRVLSVAAEKLFRVIVLKRRHNPSELANCFRDMLEQDNLSTERRKKILALTEKYKRTVEELETAIFDSRIETVHSTEELEFEFELIPNDEEGIGFLDELPEEEWRPSEKVAA